MNRILFFNSRLWTFALFFLFLIICILVISCKEEKEPGKKEDVVPQVAENMVDSVGMKLYESIDGLPDDVLDHIKACATSQLSEKNLLGSTDSVAISAAIAIGMMKGIGDYSDDQLSTVPNQDSSVKSPNKKKAITSIIKNLVLDLGQSLSGEELKLAIGKSIKAIAESFKAAGIAGEDMGAVLKEAIASSVLGLKEMGLDDQEILDISLTIDQSAMTAIGDKQNGLSSENINLATKEAVSGMVSSLSAVGFSNEDIVAKMPEIINKAMTGIGEGDVSAKQFAALSDSVKEGFVAGLKTAGMNNFEINDIYPDIESTCNTALTNLITKYPDSVTSQSLIAGIHSQLGSITSTTGLELTDEQKAAFKANMEALIANAELSDSDNLEKILPLLIQSSAKSIDSIRPVLSDEQKVEVYQNILESSQEYLIGKVCGDDAINVLGVIAESAIDHLDEMSISQTNYSSSVESIATSLIVSLGDIPLGDKSISDAASKIIGSLVKKVDTLGLTDAETQKTVKAAVSGLVSSLNKVGVSNEKIVEIMPDIVNSAMTGIGESDIDAKEFAELSDAIKEGFIAGLKTAGMNNFEINDIYPDIESTCNTALTNLITKYPDSVTSQSLIAGIHSQLGSITSTTGLELTDEQKAAFKANMEALIANAELSDSDNLEEILPLLIQSSAKSIDSIRPVLSDEQKVEVYQNILQSSQEYLDGKVCGDDAINVLGVIAESAMDHLDEMSISQTNYSSSAESITTSLIVSLDNIPLGDKSISDAVSEIIGSLVKKIDNLGLTDDETQKTVKATVSGLVSSLDQVGVSNEKIIEIMPDIVNSAMAGIGESDIDANEFVELSDAIRDGFVDGLQKKGMSNTDINNIYSDIESACDTALTDQIAKHPDSVTSQSLIDSIYTQLATIDSVTNLELTDSQKAAIKSGMEAAISDANLSDSDNLEEILPLLIQNSANSIDSISPVLSDEQKVEVYRNILTSSQEYLIGKVSGEDAVELLGTITESSINHLDEMSISTTNYSSSIESIATSLTESLDEIPLGDQSISDAASEIISSLVGNVDTLGLTDSETLETIEAAVTGTINGVSNADLNTNELIQLIGKISEQATDSALENEVDAGKTGAELIGSVNDITKSVMDGVVAAGLSTADCVEVADDIIQGAANEIGGSLSSEELNDALTEGVEGVVSGLDEAGATDEEKEEAKSNATEVVDSAVSKTADPTEPKLIISDEELMTEEGSTEKGSFKISLDKKPNRQITVSITSMDSTEGSVSPSQLIFDSDSWNKAQIVFILPIDEGYVDGEIKYQLIVKTDGGAKKTLTVTNMDNDQVGIKVTPSKKQYSSEVGGQAWYYVSLKSQPKGPIRLRWAISIGQNSIFFNPNTTRIMDFTTANYNVPQRIVIEGKVCADCEEHASVSIESQNIISMDGQDNEYPELNPESISLVNLKGGPKLMTTNAVSNDTVAVTFNSSSINMSIDDDKFIYETVFATESITMRFARYQSRPLLIKEAGCFLSGNVRQNVTITPGDPLSYPPVLSSSSFTFCLKFYNANKSQTTAGMNNWAIANDFTLNTCSETGASPNYVTCSFSGTGSSIPTLTVPANMIFSDDKVGNSAYSLNGLSGYHTSPPALTVQTYQPVVTLNYKTLSIAGANTASFSGSLQTGYWYLYDKSKSFVYGGGTYSPSLYYYVYVP